MPTVLHTPQQGRTAVERGLRAKGFVPVTAVEAPFSAYDRLLPACAVQQEIPTAVRHGRLVWSHPGASGLDPRAVGPLATVRVADGLGPEPLDSPMTLGEAARWLLSEDVSGWLTRTKHRTPISIGGNPCLWEGDVCATHPDWDAGLFEASQALGDITPPCSVYVWPKTPTSGWPGIPDDVTSTSLPDIGYQALQVTKALGQLAREGVSGAVAWEAVSGRATPVRRVTPPPPATRPNHHERGMHWYAQFSLAKRGRQREVISCQFCGAKTSSQTCAYCEREGRTAPVGVEEWHSFLPLSVWDIAYAPADPGPAVACGLRTCPTSVSRSLTSNKGVGL